MAVYFSIGMLNYSQPEKEATLKVKFTKNEPESIPLTPNLKEFTKELKDEKVVHKNP